MLRSFSAPTALAAEGMLVSTERQGGDRLRHNPPATRRGAETLGTGAAKGMLNPHAEH